MTSRVPPTPAGIRLATPEDAPSIAELYGPHVTDGATSFELAPPSAAEMRERVVSTLRQTPWLVCDQAGELLGYAYACKHRERGAYQWSLDVSVYVASTRQRRGVGRALYTSLFALACLQGYHAAYAGISLPNVASVGLHEALGFVPVGVFHAVGYKLGAWHDVGWWQREFMPRQGAPAPVIPLPTLASSAPAAFAEALAAGLRQLAE
jgi:L-amino acid N-acyltransferase YncA